MPVTHSAMSLHLQYRLWIAELNFDINVLRIFGDCLTELRTKRKEAEVKLKSENFEKQFTVLRAEIDEIRHEMQLGKMKLGAFARDAKPFDFKEFIQGNQNPIKKRLAAYKTSFKKLKQDFEEFEVQWFS
jgi:hypothetical protein